jgi:hypothetical protein
MPFSRANGPFLQYGKKGLFERPRVIDLIKRLKRKTTVKIAAATLLGFDPGKRPQGYV